MTEKNKDRCGEEKASAQGAIIVSVCIGVGVW